MEEDGDRVPDCSFVMEKIYSECDEQNLDSVPTSKLIDYMRPFMANFSTGIEDLQFLMDPDNVNPSVTRQVFYEAMRKFIVTYEARYEGNSGCSSFLEEGGAKFGRSTPTQCSSEENISNILDISTLSPTSFNGDRTNNYVERDLELLKQKYKTLESSHSATLHELSLVKNHLVVAEQSVVELQEDLDRTNKRLLHEQQVNADLQKYLENKDESQDEKINTTKEICHLQKLLASAKKENDTLITSFKDLELQAERNELKFVEIQKKEELRNREFVNLQTKLEEFEEENKKLKIEIQQLGEELKKQISIAEHHHEVSEMYKDEVDVLRQTLRKSDRRASRNSLPSMRALDNSEDNVFSSGNNISGVLDDGFDLSVESEFEISKEENLLSELQACKFLNKCETCLNYTEDSSEIIRQHENCPKIIEEYQEQVELLAKKLENAAIEHDNLLLKYTNMEREILEKTNFKNQQLLEEISKLKEQLNDDKLTEMQSLELKYKKLSEETENIKNEKEHEHLEYINLQHKYDDLIHKIETLEKHLQEIYDDKQQLVSENNVLITKLFELNEAIHSKEGEILEIQQQKNSLEAEIIGLKDEQEKNCHEIEIITEKLKHCNEIGKRNVDTVKMKISNLDTKVQFLRGYTENLSQKIDKIQEVKHIRGNKIELFNPRSEESSSTDGYETNHSERPQFRRKSSSHRRSDNELQFKIIKFEDHINFLERKLSAEKLKASQITDLETRITNLERDKVNLEEENKSIFGDLKKAQEELSYMEEKHKRLMESYHSAQEKLKVTEENLTKTNTELQTHLAESQKEKDELVAKVEKQKNKIFKLMKAVSDIDGLYKATKSVENLVLEKESLLRYNRNSLRKSNSSLQMAENRILTLELLLSKSNMVLSETATNVFRATKIVFEAWKHILERDDQLIQAFETLKNIEIETGHNLTEQDIWTVQNRLTLTSQLLEALAKNSVNECPFCMKDAHGTKNISKFTMKSAKRQFIRLPSSDPDISSSIQGEAFPPRFEEIHENNEECVDIRHEMLANTSDHSKEIESLDLPSIRRGVIRETLSERKITEKKFWLLASSWKTNYESSKQKYSCSKRQCMQLRESFLSSLLKIVTCIKEHKCYREQKSLIQALTFVEKLKDVLTDVFKMAEQCGANRQELRSMKCWNLVMDYVNGVHGENGRLVQCTSFQMLRTSQDESIPCDESENFESLVKWSQNPEDSNYKLNRGPKKRRYCFFSFIFFASFCLMMMAIYLQVECSKHTNRSMCPLDPFVTKSAQKFSPH